MLENMFSIEKLETNNQTITTKDNCSDEALTTKLASTYENS